MKYFKVNVGYQHTIKIDETELPKAIMAQITGKVVVLKNGSVRGSSITLIEPDYHRAMGYNDGYQLVAEDWAEINAKCADYKGYVSEVTQKMLDEQPKPEPHVLDTFYPNQLN